MHTPLQHMLRKAASRLEEFQCFRIERAEAALSLSLSLSFNLSLALLNTDGVLKATLLLPRIPTPHHAQEQLAASGCIAAIASVLPTPSKLHRASMHARRCPGLTGTRCKLHRDPPPPCPNQPIRLLIYLRRSSSASRSFIK